DSYGFRRARKGAAAGKPAIVADGPGAAPASESERKGEKPPAVTSPAPRPGKLDPAGLKGTIVFVSDRSGTVKVGSMRASGKGARQLTKGSDPDADPRFAPGGRQILYTTLRGGFPEVWLMQRDGSEPMFVTKGSQENWAPDGKSIIFIRDNQT